MSRLARRISITTSGLSGLFCAINFVNFVFFLHYQPLDAIANPSFFVLFLLMLFFALDKYLPEKVVQTIQVLIFLLLSGPVVLSNVYSFFGMWFFILGIILGYRYGFFDSQRPLKFSLILLYFVPFFFLGVLNTEGPTGSVLRATEYVLFVLSCFAFLFFIFEEQIRDLLSSNRAKDEALAAQAAEIARLEPLTVLGERVAHVAHSFKNNLNQVSTALFYLEQGRDPVKAAAKIREFGDGMNQRIENILLISRAGAHLEPEVFDLARVIEGMQDVYMREKAFVDRALATVTIEGPVPILAVKWDLILLVENVLRNAVEACQASGHYGQIHVTLKDRVLSIGNDGGPMDTCADCTGDCLSCSKFGRPGQTTKETGSGHGLNQVFGTCRQYNWPLRIEVKGPWTTFHFDFRNAKKLGAIEPGTM